MLAADSTTRVLEHTAPDVNEQIRSDAEERVRHYAMHPDEIETRLGELDREWDVERALATASSCFSLAPV